MRPGRLFLLLFVVPFVAFILLPDLGRWATLAMGAWFLLAAVLLWRSAFAGSWRWAGYVARAFAICVFAYQALMIPGRWMSEQAKSGPAGVAAAAEGCSSAETAILQAVMDKGATPEEKAFLQSPEGRYLSAALGGKVDEVRRYLDQGGRIDARDQRRAFRDNSALDHAARTDNVELAKLLLARGFDVNARSEGGVGHAALHVATGLGRRKVAELLLKSGARADILDPRTGTPLDVAVLQARPTMAKLLLAHGADKNGSDGASPLRTLQKAGSLCPGHKEIIKVLVEAGSDLFAEDREGRSGAMAIVWRSDETAMHLAREFPELDWNREVTFGKDRRASLLMVAVCSRSTATAGYLLAQHPRRDRWMTSAPGRWGTLLHCGELAPVMQDAVLARLDNPDAVDSRGQTALHTARDPKLVAALLARGVPVDARDAIGRTAAMNAHSEEILRLLLDAGASVTLEDARGFTVLDHAVRAGLPATRLVLQRKADPNRPNRDGLTPLHHVRREAAAKLLIDAGANVNARSSDGRTPLHEMLAGNGDAIDVLVAHGADPKARTNEGKTPLHVATRHEGMYHLLQTESGLADLKDNEGRTPLHYAARNGYPAKVHVLLDRGANANAADKAGNTPLHMAVACENLHTIEVLLKRGADPTIRNREKKSAFDLAAASERAEALKRELHGEHMPVRLRPRHRC